MHHLQILFSVYNGPNGFIGVVCLVSTQQRSTCEFLVWNTIQSNVFTMDLIIV